MKNTNVLYSGITAGLVVCILALTIAMPGLAQSSVTYKDGGPGARNNDEQTLRELVRRENDGKKVIKYTDQSITIPAGYHHPLVGAKAREQANEEISRKRLNQIVKDEPLRIVVSESGDFAYEFGTCTHSFDTPENKHFDTTGSYLRVWRKTDGEWRVDSFIARCGIDGPTGF